MISLRNLYLPFATLIVGLASLGLGKFDKTGFYHQYFRNLQEVSQRNSQEAAPVFLADYSREISFAQEVSPALSQAAAQPEWFPDTEKPFSLQPGYAWRLDALQENAPTRGP